MTSGNRDPGIARLKNKQELEGERGKWSQADVISECEGCRAWSKALDLGSSLEGVQGFESLPSH
jgi:hypothetical protein